MSITLISNEGDKITVSEDVVSKSKRIIAGLQSGFLEGLTKEVSIELDTKTLVYLVEILSITPFNVDSLLYKFKSENRELYELFNLRAYSVSYEIEELVFLLDQVIGQFIINPYYRNREDNQLYKNIYDTITPIIFKDSIEGKYTIIGLTPIIGSLIINSFVTFNQAKDWLSKELIDFIIKNTHHINNLRNIAQLPIINIEEIKSLKGSSSQEILNALHSIGIFTIKGDSNSLTITDLCNMNNISNFVNKYTNYNRARDIIEIIYVPSGSSIDSIMLERSLKISKEGNMRDILDRLEHLDIESLTSGVSGRLNDEPSIDIGPCYYQATRHHTIWR